MKYRPDIDGLRALAVLPVVMFHAGVPAFSGGFVGVDIFFVISGFLITGLLLQQLHEGTFTFKDFYVRRVRRIFPALMATVLLTLAAAYFLSMPKEFRNAGLATERVSYFFSNHLFWRTQNDYWQQNALATQPLLHTWSLAVEEQFYLVIPALLALWFAKMRRHGLVFLFTILTIVSAAISIWLMRHAPAAAFYTLPSRAWELLLGAMLAARRPAQAHAPQALGTIGLGLILWAIFTYTEATPFPGPSAVPPVLGAILIIYAGTSWVNRCLAIKPLVFIGLLSYSMYLWHWPILVLTRSPGWYAYQLPDIPLAGLLALILAVAWFSWKYIERPFRHGFKATSDWRVLAVALGVMIACFAIGRLTQRVAGKAWPIAQAVPPELVILDKDTSLRPGAACEGDPDPARIRAGQAGCRLGEPGAPQFAILGDSHARMWTDAADMLAKDHKVSGIGLTFSGCVPLWGLAPPDRAECREITAAAVDYLATSSISTIVLAGFWTHAQETVESAGDPLLALESTLQKLDRPGRRIFVLLDIPILPSDRTPIEKTIESWRRNGAAVFGQTLERHRARQMKADAAIYGLQSDFDFVVLDPASKLCDERGCLVADGGRSLYRDKHHLTSWAAVQLRGVLTPALTGG